MPAEILYDKRVQCGNGACNNGCPLMKIAESNYHRLGGKPESESSKYHREIKVEGITVIDPDLTMIGEGKLTISGKKQLSPNNKDYCHLIIKKSGNNGSEHYSPDIEEFKKIPSA